MGRFRTMCKDNEPKDFNSYYNKKRGITTYTFLKTTQNSCSNNAVNDSTVQTPLLHCAHPSHCGLIQSPGPFTWLEPSTVTVLSLLTFGLGALPEWPDPAVLTLLHVDSAVEGGVTGMGWGPCGSGR